MKNFKDESFIMQYLSPRVIRDLKLFCVVDNDEKDYLEVSAIHNKTGYQRIREELSHNYNQGQREPDIQVSNVDIRGGRSLTLQHNQSERVPLNEDTSEVLKHIHRLWGFDVHLQSTNNDEISESFHCPEEIVGT